MSEELRQAAERLHGHNTWPLGECDEYTSSDQVDADERLVVGWVMEQADPTPISEDWLRSVGLEVGRKFQPVEEDATTIVIAQTPMRFLVEAHDSEGDGCFLRSVKTRGELRRLCSALGIELNEPEGCAP